MKIKSTMKNGSGQIIGLEYQDIDSMADIGDKKIHAVHGFSFLNDKMVIVYNPKKDRWTPPGGGVEEGENAEEATRREIKEEANMKVIAIKFIGMVDILEPEYTRTHVRSVCIVEPYGEFTSDPDGDITEIKLIDPAEYKKYFDWGEGGDYVVKRALILLEELKKGLV